MGAIRAPRFLKHTSPTLVLLYWLNYYFTTRLTLIGRIMILVGLLMLPYCLLGINHLPMNYLAISLIALYIINFFVGYLFKPKLSIHRTLPKEAICKQPTTVKYKIINERKLPCWDLKLDTSTYPGCSFSSDPTFPFFKQGGSSEIDSTITFKNRGVYNMPAVYAESSFPFGLSKWGCFGQGNREVRVQPSPTEIQKISPAFLNAEKTHGLYIGSRDPGMEFSSCREFRYGDNPKHIHWNSWAKTNTPIVREMTDEGQAAVSVIFDPCYPVNAITRYNDIQKNFELAVSFLAGVSKTLSRQKNCIRNLIIGEEIKRFSGDDPQHIHQEILNYCCDIQDIRSLEELQISNYMIESVQNSLGMIIILLNYDESRKKLIEKINQSGIACTVYLLCDKTPKTTGPFTAIEYETLNSKGLGQI